jgi:hypothetical protein
MQGNGNDTTDPETSNSEWQLEKQQLEQRIPEIEASGDMFMPLTEVVVAPERARKPRKKAPPVPFFRRAVRQAMDFNSLESEEKKEKARRTPKLESTKEKRIAMRPGFF